MEEKIKLIYRLEGFSSLKITDNFEYSLEHDCIESYCFDEEFEHLNITLHNGVDYTDNQEKIDNKSNEIFLALLLTLNNCDTVVKLVTPPKVLRPKVVEEMQDGKKFYSLVLLLH